MSEPIVLYKGEDGGWGNVFAIAISANANKVARLKTAAQAQQPAIVRLCAWWRGDDVLLGGQ